MVQRAVAVLVALLFGVFGMDVVNAAVASLGGSIRIESREYMGTTFFMEFPVVDEMHAEG